MKLTWFGGKTLRIHIGGEILVCDADGAPGHIDRHELLSGADRAFAMSGGGPAIDAARWQPRRPAALIDEAKRPEVLVHEIGSSSVLVDAVGEPPLLLLTASVSAGRWGRDAVVVAFAGDVADGMLRDLSPRLMALAMSEPDADAAISRLRDRLGSTALVALEPGMALEV
jgi:hypothetical protein